jgi:hypothetical protein
MSFLTKSAFWWSLQPDIPFRGQLASYIIAHYYPIWYPSTRGAAVRGCLLLLSSRKLPRSMSCRFEMLYRQQTVKLESPVSEPPH